VTVVLVVIVIVGVILIVAYLTLLTRIARRAHQYLPRQMKPLFNWYMKRYGDPGDARR
jgi:hypothetical protein